MIGHIKVDKDIEEIYIYKVDKKDIDELGRKK